MTCDFIRFLLNRILVMVFRRKIRIGLSGTKMSNFDNCEKSEEVQGMRGLIDGECSFGTMRNTPRFSETSFRAAVWSSVHEALSLV